MPENQQSAPGSLFDAGELLYILFRRKWMVLALTALGLVGAGIVYVVTPRIYESEAVVLVRYVTDRPALDPETLGEKVIRPDSRSQNIINTEMAVLTSPDLIERVVDEVGPARIVKTARERTTQASQRLTALLQMARISIPGSLSFRAGGDDRLLASQYVMGQMQTLSDPKSNVIRLQCGGPSPEIAQEILQRLVETYLRKHVEIHRSAGSYEFLNQQTDQYRARLAQTEDELSKLKNQFGVTTLDQSRELLAKRIDASQVALNDSEAALAACQAKVKALTQAVTSGAGDEPAASILLPTDSRQQPLDALSRLRLREQELLAVYTSNSLPVRDVQAHIRELDQLRAGTNVVVAAQSPANADIMPALAKSHNRSPLRVELLSEQATAAYLEAKIEILKNQLTKVQEDTKKLQGAEDQISQLQRRKEMEEANYRYFAQGLEKARIDASLDSEKLSNISIIQPATRSESVQRPKMARNILLALLAGVGAGLGLAFFTEKIIDQTVKHPAELETAQKSDLLLTIPHQPTLARQIGLQAGSRVTRLLPSHGQSSELPGKTAAAQVSANGGLNEHFEALRDRVLGATKRVPGRPFLLGITGCMPGAGVSTTASGLAMALARNGDGRILLVDASMLSHDDAKDLWQKGSAMAMLDIAADGAGNVAILQPNLFVLSAEEVNTEGRKGIASPSLEEAMRHLRDSRYAFVIFDMPPVGDASLSLRLASHIDGVILLVQAEKDHRELVRRARKLMEQAHATLIGTVLTKRRQYVPVRLHPGL